MYRLRPEGPQVLLIHPGGPFWAAKDRGAWSIPKGEIEEGEETLAAAMREFEEETGMRPAAKPGEYRPLRSVVLKSRKTVYAWAFEGDFDPERLTSSTFIMEWPPRSGMEREFPEVDRAGWFSLDAAREKIQPGQLSFVEELAGLL